MFLSSSRSSQFYKFLLTQQLKGCNPSQKNIVARVNDVLHENNISLVNLFCDKQYLHKVKCNLKVFPECGVADSVRYVLSWDFPDISLLHGLLAAF